MGMSLGMNMNLVNHNEKFDDIPDKIIIELHPCEGAKEGSRNCIYHIVNADGYDLISGIGWDVRDAAKEALDDYEDCFLTED